MSAVEEKTETKREDGPKSDETGQILLFTSKFEGVKVTDFRLNFSGNVAIGDKDIIEAVALDEEVTFIVKGRVNGRGHKTKNVKDGAKSEAISSSTILIETVALYEE